MEDITKEPWAEWIEDTLRYAMKTHPTSIGIVLLSEGEDAATAYWGKIGPAEQSMMACHINADATLQMVLNNAGKIADAIDELEDEG